MSFTGALLRRLRGALALLCVAAFLATGALACGAALFVRGRALQARVPNETRFYVVARSALIDATRELLAGVPDVRVGSERRANEVLRGPGDASAYPDRLRVIEVAMANPIAPDALAARTAQIRALDGVVDLLDLNARERGEATPARARRHMALGAIVLVIGATMFVAAVVATLRAAERACREEIGARILLGAAAERIWAPLGLVVALAALLGSAFAYAASLAGAQFLASTSTSSVPIAAALEPRWSAAGALLLLLVGTTGLAMLIARRTVARATRAVALASLAAIVSLAIAGVPAMAEEGNGNGTAAHEVQHIREIARELAVCRRSLHLASQSFLETERRALRAAAEEDEIVLALAALQRLEDLSDVSRWRDGCDALERSRAQTREALHTARMPGPPIEPRIRPVPGVVAVAFAKNGGKLRRSDFRNGVGLATRTGQVVRATAPGKVAYAGAFAGSGRVVVVIDHGQRTFSVYAKIAEALVVRGMEVESGEPIARAGGEALYFSIRRRGRVLDPMRWIARGAPNGSPAAVSSVRAAARE